MDLYPVKAQYLLGEEVVIRLELGGTTASLVVLKVFHLQNELQTITLQDVHDAADVSVGIFQETFAGYGIHASISCGGVESHLTTSFDVVDNPKRSLRYGFLSDFSPKDLDNGAIKSLRKYHINMVQFYDWSFRHDSLVAQETEYIDMMGKHISGDVVRAKIAEGQLYGMHSIAYGAIYAASKDFFDSHQEWAFYNSEQKPFVFIDVFYIMNIATGSLWRQHLYQQYRNAIEKMGFAGIHMDTYGFPKTAYSHIADSPELVHLDMEFPSLINETRDALLKVSPDPYLIFNNVGNWPVYATAASLQDAVYIEVWNPFDRYEHIAQIIREARYYGGSQKSIILAAYLKPFQEKDNYAEASVAALILTAAIVSQGAYHLLLGERNAVLTQGYYSDYSILSDQSAAKMRRYYDFMIRYLELFYDPTLKNVSMSHMGWDNYEYACASHHISASGEAGKIWATIRENDERKCIFLVNLCGCQDDYWNSGKPQPTHQTNVKFIVQVDFEVQGIYSATPDSDLSNAVKLDFSYISKPQGRFVSFILPELSVWSIVWIQF